MSINTFTVVTRFNRWRLDALLFVNVHGSNYDADGMSIYNTLVDAGASATWVNLSSDGQAAALLQQNQYDQVWVFDLSTSPDNYPADYQAISDWYDARPTTEIICDGRMISSYWNGRWQNEGMKLTGASRRPPACLPFLPNYRVSTPI